VADGRSEKKIGVSKVEGCGWWAGSESHQPEWRMRERDGGWQGGEKKMSLVNFDRL
jgi:hypothetical protein